MSFDIRIAASTESFYVKAARFIINQIKAKPNSVLGLSTGRTTGGIHKAAANIYNKKQFDTSQITVFGLDEVTGVSREYWGSCYYMLLHEFVEPLDIKPENYLMFPTTSKDWRSDCEKLRTSLEERGNIDLLVLGIGENGHLGFNQPGTPFGQRAFTSYMDERLNARIHKETDTPDDVPLGGVTLGIKDIMESRKLLLCANGEHKRKILHEALYGPITEKLPASVLQLHNNLTVICDAEAYS